MGHSTPLPPCERGCQSSGIAGTHRGHLPASAATSESLRLSEGQESLDQHRCGRFNRLCLRGNLGSCKEPCTQSQGTRSLCLSGPRWPQRELITVVFMLLPEVGVHLVLLQLPLINVQLAAPARDPSEGLTLVTESAGKRECWGAEVGFSLSFALY